MSQAETFFPTINELEALPVAVVRERVAMNEIKSFYERAFDTVAEAVEASPGARLGGPPLAVYFSMPENGSVEVGAGFAVAGALGAEGVEQLELPGGRAAQVVHLGHYDGLDQTYRKLMAWLEEQGEQPGPLAWETYVEEPDPDDPSGWMTLITWPLAG